MEAIWVAAEMRAGGAYAYSVVALDALRAEGDGRRAEKDRQELKAFGSAE